MILVKDFQKFHSIIAELEESQIQYKLYGKMEETYSGAYIGFSETPPNNTLRIKLVALTAIGTIFCNSSIKLTETDSVQNAKQLFEKLPVFDSEVSCHGDSGYLQGFSANENFFVFIETLSHFV